MQLRKNSGTSNQSQCSILSLQLPTEIISCMLINEVDQFKESKKQRLMHKVNDKTVLAWFH